MKTREPVVLWMSILGGLQFFFAGSATISILSSNETIAGVMGVGALAVAAAQAGIQFYVRGQVIPVEEAVHKAEVVEQLEHEVVVAGPANDRLNEGAYIRALDNSSVK